MTYDFILMNPPYDKNLHLKVVEQSIPMLTEDGVLVNLSPIRWVQDPLAKYKKTSDWYKFEESVAKHIESLEVVTATTASTIFNVRFTMDLGIYAIDKGTYSFYKDFNHNSIVDKVVDKETEVLNDKLEYNVSDGWRVRLSEMKPVPTEQDGHKDMKAPGVLSTLFETTHNTLSWVYKDGYTRNGIHWSKNKLPGAGGKVFGTDTPIPQSISFQSETEAVNFENSTKTTFHRYLVLKMKTYQNFPMKYIPFMGDCTNPRTGMVGYESEWTDEDFRAYFGITDGEWENILETMKPYL